MAAKKAVSVYQLKVTLRGTKPPIWRRLQVPADMDLGTLHTVIQLAMGWGNCHLHQFLVGDACYSDPEFEMEDPDVGDENETLLSEVAPAEGARFRYEYDFGDGWDHDILVEKVLPPGERPGPRAVCLGGKRACPPEDCGAVSGYQELVEAMRDPKHGRHEELKEWLGGRFDPEEFDLADVNAALRKVG